MSVQLKPSDKIKQVDPAWDAVRANAKAVVADEPALAAMVMAHVLNQPTFEAALELTCGSPEEARSEFSK